MEVETLSGYAQVGLWLGLLEKTVVLLSGKVCEIIDENVKAPHIYDWTVTQYKFSHHQGPSLWGAGETRPPNFWTGGT